MREVVGEVVGEAGLPSRGTGWRKVVVGTSCISGTHKFCTLEFLYCSIFVSSSLEDPCFRAVSWSLAVSLIPLLSSAQTHMPSVHTTPHLHTHAHIEK